MLMLIRTKLPKQLSPPLYIVTFKSLRHIAHRMTHTLIQYSGYGAVETIKEGFVFGIRPHTSNTP